VLFTAGIVGFRILVKGHKKLIQILRSKNFLDIELFQTYNIGKEP
jgi:hypothetical protein